MDAIKKETCPACGNRLDQPFGKDPILQLFALWKNQRSEYLIIAKGQRELVQRLINEYGYKLVYESFVDACADTTHMRLNYLRGILKNKHAQLNAKKAVAEAVKMKKETAAKAGLGLNELISKLKNEDKKKPDKDYKNSEEYKIKKQKFENDLLKKEE